MAVTSDSLTKSGSIMHLSVTKANKPRHQEDGRKYAETRRACQQVQQDRRV